MDIPGLGQSFVLQIIRDLRLAFRNMGQLTNPLMFFVMVTTLFPLALNPSPQLLEAIAPGVVWVAALLASLLAAEGLFRQDVDDGTMEQLALSPQPLALMLLAKTTAHWLMTGLPLVIVSPIVAYGLFLPRGAVPVTMLALALATPILSLIGGMMAALVVGLRRGGGLLSFDPADRHASAHFRRASHRFGHDRPGNDRRVVPPCCAAFAGHQPCAVRHGGRDAHQSRLRPMVSCC